MEDFIKIKVGKHTTGIVGLKTVLAEIVAKNRDVAEKRIGALLREKLAHKNYIPATSAEMYEQAFFREYKKYIGEPIEDEDETSGELMIKVLGLGCPRCEQLHSEVMLVLAENGIPADLAYIDDPLEIATYGVLTPPALIINNTVMSAGNVPSKTRLKAWILESSH